MTRRVIGLDRRWIAFGAVILLLAAAAFYFLLVRYANAPDGSPWEEFLAGKGVLQEGSWGVQVHSPREVSPGVVLLDVEEKMAGAEPGGPLGTLVRHSDVYVDWETGEAVNAAYYVTTENPKKAMEEALYAQLSRDWGLPAETGEPSGGLFDATPEFRRYEYPDFRAALTVPGELERQEDTYEGIGYRYLFFRKPGSKYGVNVRLVKDERFCRAVGDPLSGMECAMPEPALRGDAVFKCRGSVCSDSKGNPVTCPWEYIVVHPDDCHYYYEFSPASDDYSDPLVLQYVHEMISGLEFT